MRAKYRVVLILAIVLALIPRVSAEDENDSLDRLHAKHAALAREEAQLRARLREVSEEIVAAHAELIAAGGLPFPPVPPFLANILLAGGQWHDLDWLRTRVSLLMDHAKKAGNKRSIRTAAMSDASHARDLANEIKRRIRELQVNQEMELRARALAGYWELKADEAAHLGVEFGGKVRVLLHVMVLNPKAERPAGRYGIVIRVDGKVRHRAHGAWQRSRSSFHAIPGTLTLDGKARRPHGSFIEREGVLHATPKFLPIASKWSPEAFHFGHIPKDEGWRLMRVLQDETK